MGLKQIGEQLIGVGDGATKTYKTTNFDNQKNEFTDPNAAANKAALQAMAAQRAALGPTNVVGAQFQGAQLGDAQSQFRAGQFGLVDALQQQAMGQGPSLANMQMQRGLDAAIAAQASQAASARGISPGLAARLAARNTASLQAQTANDAAMLRMQEQMAARNQLAGVLSGARGQDIDFAGQNANLAQQAAMQNAQLSQQANLANQQAWLQNQAQVDAMGQFGMGQQVGIDASSFAAQQAYQNQRYQEWLAKNQINSGVVTAANQANAQMTGALIGAGGTVVGGLVGSDKNLKTKVADADSDVGEFLDSIKPQSWDYKDKKWGEGRHTGFMAQDAERSALGKALVINTNEGKLVDTKKLVMALAASAAHLNKRVRQLEGK